MKSYPRANGAMFSYFTAVYSMKPFPQETKDLVYKTEMNNKADSEYFQMLSSITKIQDVKIIEVGGSFSPTKNDHLVRQQRGGVPTIK